MEDCEVEVLTRMNSPSPLASIFSAISINFSIELCSGGPTGCPKLRYKDTCKSELECGKVLDRWKSKVENRQKMETTHWSNLEIITEKRFSGYERRKEKTAPPGI